MDPCSGVEPYPRSLIMLLSWFCRRCFSRLFQWACSSSLFLARDLSILKASLTCPARLPHLWPALRSLELSPLPVPSHLFTTLIRQLGETGLPLPFHAKHLFLSMPLLSCACPDVYTGNALLHAIHRCRRARTLVSTSSPMSLAELLGQALALFDYMDGMGNQPDVITCNILINGLLRAGQLKPAFQVFFLLVHDIGANTISSTGIMDALPKANEASKDLVKLITYLKNWKCIPNVVTYGTPCVLILATKDNQFILARHSHAKTFMVH
ncbi:hypothetical protein GOP47_0021422 [Adiantum capillus-veneris]|uniref:Pentatricopeptide repeat-containing protein n=1 Tax=Adiantum capillus-veneris TaxID=13818 RepID=A0A9D4Z6H9_ADICA|nr:hypothetical protein GOP47_0021422 [Adiantum capillus-veneris]